MTELAFYLVVFLVVGSFFLFIHLLMGKFIRPYRPGDEKLTIYECGEPTVGSAWVQFDLRFYVVALLFVIFDVEMAFFFPWAVVFGRSNQLADPRLPAAERLATTKAFLVPPVNATDASQARAVDRFENLLTVNPATATAEEIARAVPAVQRTGDLAKDRERFRQDADDAVRNNAQAASD